MRNGDRWTVLRVEGDGTVVARRVGRRWGATVRLPAEYAAAEVELGYAVTTHRAQGLTVDTGHVIVTARSTREAAYVGMTRGRDSNTAYVATDERDDDHTVPHLTDHRDHDQQAAARAVFTEVLARSGAERSAHDTLRHEQDAATSVGVLAAEYDTIATAAQHDRWVALIHASPLAQGQAEAVVASEAFGVLGHALRRAEADHHDPEALLFRVVSAGPMDDATDIAAVLTARLERATAILDRGRRSRGAPRLIVGLIPEAVGPMPEEMADALGQRQQLIENRVTALVDAAAQTQPAWMTGTRPTEIRAAARWDVQARIVLAYRDLHGITSSLPPGGSAENRNQGRDRARVVALIQAAQEGRRPGVHTAARAQSPAPSRDGIGRSL